MDLGISFLTLFDFFICKASIQDIHSTRILHFRSIWFLSLNYEKHLMIQCDADRQHKKPSTKLSQANSPGLEEKHGFVTETEVNTEKYREDIHYQLSVPYYYCHQGTS